MNKYDHLICWSYRKKNEPTTFIRFYKPDERSAQRLQRYSTSLEEPNNAR